MVPESAVDLVDLIELKMLPAWVKGPASAPQYEHFEGEEEQPPPRKEHRYRKSKPLGRDGPSRRLRDRSDKRRHEKPRQSQDRHKPPVAAQVTVRFLPHPPALENVVAQIKSGSVAYSLFALARLFLEKPTRYDVRLTAQPDSPMWQLGENGVLSVDRQFLERDAFRFAQSNFYKIDITETEPIKGNFSNVARCRLSGTLLGPTNHHGYQHRLRHLYEQRFNHRMSFADYKRQIEIVNEPDLVERWKEKARKMTSFTTLREEIPATFAAATEAEQHFRQNYLPGLIRSVAELTVGGVASRSFHDRVLSRLVEDEWAHETRSPSRMMQELAVQFRRFRLHVLRHRGGMLFVSPIYPRVFEHDETRVSPQVQAILDAVAATPHIGRKELADKLIVRPGESVLLRIDLAGEEEERAKLALASDLHWLISEGYLIEFNDGSLDLPRMKKKPPVEAAVSAANGGSIGIAKPKGELVGSTESRPTEEGEIGGS